MADKASEKRVNHQRTERIHTKDGAALRLVGALGTTFHGSWRSSARPV